MYSKHGVSTVRLGDNLFHLLSSGLSGSWWQLLHFCKISGHPCSVSRISVMLLFIFVGTNCIAGGNLGPVDMAWKERTLAFRGMNFYLSYQT
jgi:hypothetical protein